MGLDHLQLAKHVVAPALYRLAEVIPWSLSAVQLVLGTAIVESDLKYLDQIDYQNKPGPAFGLWQIEGLTFRDHLQRAKPVIQNAIAGIYMEDLEVMDLWWNLRLGAQMCRLLYWHAPEKLPEAGDAEGMAKLWKLRYNTALGAGTVEKALPGFLKACQYV